MKDFASVIWAVIIVGAMIFNVVSQSRKARGKGARQTPHGEAWPRRRPPTCRCCRPHRRARSRPHPFCRPRRSSKKFPLSEYVYKRRRQKRPKRGLPGIGPPNGSELLGKGCNRGPRHYRCAGRGGGHRRAAPKPAAGRGDLLGDTETPFRRGIGRLVLRALIVRWPLPEATPPQSANTFLNSIRRWQPFFHASLRLFLSTK